MFSLSLNENQVLLNDRDPVRWYESVKNTILNVVKLPHLVLRIGVPSITLPVIHVYYLLYIDCVLCDNVSYILYVMLYIAY